ncbi:CapA family protein [Streptomyces sp. LP05-1]|uniref:CapA family protein n=1 Tax=Streptomyces pyxinae TaxID=2970734 RepID=A0ABT2CR03_9ACTN|nr:CapA family protein [Streptomyces sp. LP05-1]MCS0639854.1 CapA family protein [Streptomyces sp. LP05-1]
MTTHRSRRPRRPRRLRTLRTARTARTARTKTASRTAALAAVLLAVSAASAGCADPAPPGGPPHRAAARPGPSPGAATARPGNGARPPGPRPFTLVATGDVLPHGSIIDQAHKDAGGKGHDFRPMLSGVKPVIAGADLAICHMETIYAEDAGPFTGYPAFKSPPQIATALAATGYDSCSTASNHTLDDGTAGLGRTLDALDKAGVRHAGSARTAAEAARPTLLKAGGATVAHLAYTYGVNKENVPEDRPWTVNITDPEKIVTAARAARKAGADLVVVSMHWGTEWQEEIDVDQRDLAEILTGSTDESGAGATTGATTGSAAGPASGARPDIDLIIGTHTHVPQAYEKVNGTWVVYGMGDQIAGDMINNDGVPDPRGNQGSIGRFTFTPPTAPGARWTVSRAEFLPQWFDTATGRATLVGAAIRRGEPLTAVRDTIAGAVLSRGAAEDGLVMGN